MFLPGPLWHVDLLYTPAKNTSSCFPCWNCGFGGVVSCLRLGGIGVTLQAHRGHLGHCVVTLLRGFCWKLSTGEWEVIWEPVSCRLLAQQSPCAGALAALCTGCTAQGTVAWLCLCFYRGLCERKRWPSSALCQTVLLLLFLGDMYKIIWLSGAGLF